MAERGENMEEAKLKLGKEALTLEIAKSINNANGC